MAGAVILDTNLLVLIVVGRTRRQYIRSHKRLSAYDARDFDIVTTLVNAYGSTILIPHVLSEASSLLRQIDEPARAAIMGVFAQIVCQSSEAQIDSCRATRRPEYRWLGLTDAAVMVSAEVRGTILTVDAGLHHAAFKAGCDAVNYLHVKEQRRALRL